MAANNERVAVFIDGQNLYYAIRDGLKVPNRVNIELLIRKLLAGRQLTRAYYYTTSAPELSGDPSGGQRFLEALGWIENLEKRLGRLMQRSRHIKCPRCSHEFDQPFSTQKGVDTRIVLDMWRLAVSDRYDTGILVCGDQDLEETVRAIKEHTNKRIENAFVMWQGWARPLREAADRRISLDIQFLQDCWMQPPK